MKKTGSVLGKLMIAVLCVIFGVILLENKGIQAAEEGTVRVSTQKQLNKAIKDPDVKTIIFRTQAEIEVKIKAAEEAKTKDIIIDAQNAAVYNKAVFSSVTLESIGGYYERVSGNDIIVSFDTNYNWFYIGKNKTVNSITVNTTSWNFDGNYFLGKGAKVKSLNINYTGGEDIVSGVYDPEKNQITIDYTNPDDVNQLITITLDKRGQIVKFTSESDNEDYAYSYFKVFDEYGHPVKIIGNSPAGGFYVKLTDYTPDTKFLKQEVTSEIQTSSVECEYNEKGERISEKSYIVDYVEGEEVISGYSYTFDHDEKGHIVKRVFNGTTGERQGQYEDIKVYNSKGFLISRTEKYSGDYWDGDDVTFIYTYKYNKAGDLVKQKFQEGEQYVVIEATYNELGERSGIELADIKGDVEDFKNIIQKYMV